MAHYNLGVIYSKQKQYEKAIEYLQNAINMDNSLVKAFNVLGNCYRFKG